ncbi:Predicted alpha/beta hydrolase [Streptomyces sp. 2231.1]|uniref:alpha/beta hydrolase family protein n=1 Tax=Streptomyces sp. 2231.1 TaxID=1855347 RepID=UPI00089C4D9D|nr:alpha/beta fold hydrolase [Streptomyces sp. 2231.1]SEE25205.1 Predicted alpha/beta hydrolase [Streptomyces sp. 2231.1]
MTTGSAHGSTWRIEVPDARDGVQHLGASVVDARSAPRAVVVICPALGVNASYYGPFRAHLARRGIATVAVDLRGQGDSRPRAGRHTRHGYHELATRDWPAVIRATRDRFHPDVPLFLLGHSIGGQVSVLHAAHDPKSADGVILVAAGSVDHRGFSGSARLRVLAATHFIAAVASLWGYWPGHRLGFGGRQSALLMRDWARICRTGRFAPAGADFDYEAAMPGATLPVLAVSVEGDRLAPRRAVDRLCAKLPSATIDRWHFSPEDGARLDHVRWARDGEGIAERISEWLGRHHGH